MLVCGKNVVNELINNNVDIKRIWLSEKFNERDILNKLPKDILVYKKQYQLDEMLERNQGIIVEIADFDYCSLDDIIIKREYPLIVLLDHIEDPHNFGAIIRTCEAAGVDGIIIPKNRSVSVNSTVMKTSAGALANMKIALVNNVVEAMKYLKENGYWVIGMDMNGTDYNEIDYKMPVCLVVGNEGKGLKKLSKENCDIIASIPMDGQINSLNASVACGVMIYQVVNKRR